MLYITMAAPAPPIFPSVPPRSAGYAPAVKVMTQQPHAEAALILFDPKFRDHFMVGQKRIKLQPSCVTEHPLDPRQSNAMARLRQYKTALMYDTNNRTVCVGFTLDSVPGGEGHVPTPEAISVQTHGYIDVGITKNYNDVNAGDDVTIRQLAQPPTDYKTMEFPGPVYDPRAIQIMDSVIGKVAVKHKKLNTDPQQGFCRIRLKLNGAPLKM